MENMNLERFKIAQADSTNGLRVAVDELRKGQKKSHWIWYTFPQLRILGRSPTAQFYGIENAAEAREYVQDPELANNLILAMEAALAQLEGGVAVEVLMGGYTDSLKLVSCCTLFKYAADQLASPKDDTGSTIQRLADRLLYLAGEQDYAECVATRMVVCPPA